MLFQHFLVDVIYTCHMQYILIMPMFHELVNIVFMYAQIALRTIGAVVHGGSTIFCSGSPTGVRDVQRHLVFPVDFYILNGQIGHKKGISAKHWYVASFEIVQIH